MKRRIFTAAILTLMLLQVVGGAQPAAAWTTYCDAAAFIADVTVPDGTVFAPNTAFTKTWQIKNIGTCTWTTSYSLVFVQGSQMGGPASVPFTQTVAPGQTVNLSVNLTAPSSNGQYQGYWGLKNASGTVFGIGLYANQPFWVLINVSTGGSSVGYDFVANMCSAAWSSGAGSLGCPGTSGNSSGYELQVTNPQLENGTTASSPGLLTVPQNVPSGFIQGVYPAYTVQSGDHFQSIVNCQYGASGCNVYFQLQYQVGSGTPVTYWQFHEKYEGLYYTANVDLSPLAGQSVKFILRVVVYDSATNNLALWGSPRIVSGSGTVPPPTPPPPSSSCDKAAFIADVTVPDYTVFAPNTAFTKTWRLKNVGTCTWTTSYKLTWVSGNPMSAVYPVSLPTSVAPGASIDVSANMVSPSTAGTYQSNWMLQNASGTNFGIGSSGTGQFWALIRVSGTPPPPPPTSCDRAAFVADVTVPDYTVFSPNVAFTKTWRLKNIGTCTWTTSYKLTWVSGNPMSAVYPVALPTSVAPGATVDVSANMVSPSTAGTYQGNWMLQNASGANFGIGSSGTSYFWVLIQVSGSGPTPTSTPTPVPGTTPGASADLVVTMSDGASTYVPGSVVYYTITVTNNGPNNVNGAIFSLDAPHQASSYSVSCVADPGAFCGAGPYGLTSGAVYTDTINVPVAGKVTYSETVYIPSNTTTNLTNVASASNPAGISDPNTANSTASDTNSAAPKADLVLIGNVSETTYHPGDQITYVFTVTNNGPSDAVGATFGGSVSTPNITSWVLNCSPNAGTTCTATQSGTSSSYSDTISIPAGYSLAYTLIVTTSLSATGAATDTTTVTVASGTTDPNTGNNTLTFSANQ